MFSVAEVVLAAALIFSPTGLAPAEECSHGARTSGECVAVTTEVSDSGVTVGAELRIPGTSPSQPVTPTPVFRPPSGLWSPPPPRDPVVGSDQCRNTLAGSCRGSSPPKNPPKSSGGAPPVLGPTPPTRLSDVASFEPSGSAIVVQPGWWSLPRVPTNIYSMARSETQPGELLGWPIEVAFTPRAFIWSYGDGATKRLSNAGGSWGVAQFSPTATFHTYRAPGVYSVGLSVEYAVSYRFPGGAFVELPGRVIKRMGTTSVRVLSVSPVLTNSGCAPVALDDGRCRQING